MRTRVIDSYAVNTEESSAAVSRGARMKRSAGTEQSFGKNCAAVLVLERQHMLVNSSFAKVASS